MSDDPRVLLAAARTLLAWQRTSLSLMGFGFLIERFGLFLRELHPETVMPRQHVFALVIGVLFIVLGVLSAFLSTQGYRRFVREHPAPVPHAFGTRLGVIGNYLIALIGLALIVYLVSGSNA